MALKAATNVAQELRRRLAEQSGVRMIFAAAPSQTEFLGSLVEQPGVVWNRATAFHMDEYLGLADDAPQRFGLWLRRAIFDKLPFAAIHLIEPGDDPEFTAPEYARKLDEGPIDIVCLGIGVNGHLAFNDPPADLNDPLPVKIVHLDAACRKQQVDDQCFSRIEDVPERAITLTITAPARRRSALLLRSRGDEARGGSPDTARLNWAGLSGDGTASSSTVPSLSRPAVQSTMTGWEVLVIFEACGSSDKLSFAT